MQGPVVPALNAVVDEVAPTTSFFTIFVMYLFLYVYKLQHSKIDDPEIRPLSSARYMYLTYLTYVYIIYIYYVHVP